MQEWPDQIFHNKGESLEIERITSADLQVRAPEMDETVIVLQRNAKDDRRENSEDIGALEKEAAEQARKKAKEIFDGIFGRLSEKERKTLDVMIVASDAVLTTPSGIKNNHKRAVETAEQIISGLRESMEEFDILENQFLNSSATQDGGTIEVSELKDLSMMEESPEFVDFLKNKYGTGAEFWDAYEADLEKETRLQMKAEGPDDIARRVNYALSVQAQIAHEYHMANPGRRLIIWAVSHYDSISPFIKKNIAGMDMKSYLPVDQGAGISINIDNQGKATCVIQEKEIGLN
ncbi:MAG: hypothetical protein Q8L10_04190 [Candidatus Moranbacteria bacterium]|nr:hypothetical protein [Candidatus Moranbacteria bacterium]